MVEIMSKAQACLIKCLRISGMDMGQIIEVLEMVWEEEDTLEMLEILTQKPTLNQAKLYEIASKISQKQRKQTM